VSGYQKNRETKRYFANRKCRETGHKLTDTPDSDE
jgi:hypothetical protein